ncbi:MAG: hypothetical protein AAF192_15920 [Pseudomonadota bacterium]
MTVVFSSDDSIIDRFAHLGEQGTVPAASVGTVDAAGTAPTIPESMTLDDPKILHPGAGRSATETPQEPSR